MDKTTEWVLVPFTDSDWAGDKDNRLSVSGFIIFLLGVPILWRSRAQRSVSLSSSEAEYKACSEAACEVKFVYQVLPSIGIKVELPIVMQIDNVGAIFMAETANSQSRSRHVDCRYHFVREMIVDGFLRVKFVRSTENISDPYTKNVSGQTFEVHTETYVQDRDTVLGSQES